MFYRPKLKEIIYEYLQTCEICQMNKSKNIKNPRLVQPLKISEGAWQCVSMKFITEYPSLRANDNTGNS
jgi:hypothetical protein